MAFRRTALPDFHVPVVRNQHDIDENIYNKKFVEKSLLPKDLRRVNAVSATFVFLLVLLLSNLKTVVARVLSLAGDLVSIIFNAILRIIEKIGPDAAEPESIEIPGDLLEQGMEQAPPSPYMNLFINIVQYFIVLYLAYKLVLLFISKIPSIVSALSGLLRRLFGVKTEEACDEESDFIDISEIVLPERAEKERRRASKKKRRTARYLRRITDPAERIRYMYGLILDMLPQRGISPLPSDTTAEILAKAGETDGLPPFTAIYEQVRYGDGSGPETLETAEQHYAKASDAIKDKSVTAGNGRSAPRKDIVNPCDSWEQLNSIARHPGYKSDPREGSTGETFGTWPDTFVLLSLCHAI